MREIKKGDIYYARLNPIIGSEQNGTRPVVVAQNNLANKSSPVVLIAPITSKVNSKPRLKTHVFIKENGKIIHDSIILLEQIRVLDKSRLSSYIWSLNEYQLGKVDDAIIASFDIDMLGYLDRCINGGNDNARK